MTVALFASPTHKAVVFSYDTESHESPKGESISIVAENFDTGDIGSREAPNVGTFVLFYPFEFVGADVITVTGFDGGEDTGTVSIS